MSGVWVLQPAGGACACDDAAGPPHLTKICALQYKLLRCNIAVPTELSPSGRRAAFKPDSALSGREQALQMQKPDHLGHQHGAVFSEIKMVDVGSQSLR